MFPGDVCCVSVLTQLCAAAPSSGLTSQFSENLYEAQMVSTSPDCQRPFSLYNQHSQQEELIKAVLLAGLYPNLIQVPHTHTSPYLGFRHCLPRGCFVSYPVTVTNPPLTVPAEEGLDNQRGTLQTQQPGLPHAERPCASPPLLSQQVCMCASPSLSISLSPPPTRIYVGKMFGCTKVLEGKMLRGQSVSECC